jgi:hypothetical protein
MHWKRQLVFLTLSCTLSTVSLRAQGEPKGPVDDAKHRNPEPKPAPAKPAPATCAKPEWQCHLDWSSHDQGYVDCPAEYQAYSPQCHLCTPGWSGHPDCLNTGGRARMMQYARESAKAGHCDKAFSEAVVTQCHNPGAIEKIRAAGVEAVCRYLRNIDTIPSSAMLTVPKSGPKTPADVAH